LRGLMPDEPEVAGLLALMLLQDSRRDARAGPAGELVLLQDQDRRLWDLAEVEEGLGIVGRLPIGVYALQAAIAAEHARAEIPAATDWPRIAELYALLARAAPSPVVDLNHAVAVAMAEGPERGLELIDRIDALHGYHLFHASRADLLRRLGRDREAAEAYTAALELASQPAEREFLRGRLASVSS